MCLKEAFDVKTQASWYVYEYMNQMIILNYPHITCFILFAQVYVLKDDPNLCTK